MIRQALARKQDGHHHGFRWRSHEITRVEGFSDAVFAFAVTLLVVSLEVPRTFHELQELMHGFVAFAIGFCLLFIIWYNQYKFFRLYGMQDEGTLVLNGILLFVVLFFVYPLKFLFGYLVRAFTHEGIMVVLPGGETAPMVGPGEAGPLMLIYSGGYMAVFGIFALMVYRAYRRREELSLTSLEQFDTRKLLREHLINVAIGGLSALVILLKGSEGAGLSGLTYVLIAPAMALHGSLSGRARKKLEGSLTPA